MAPQRGTRRPHTKRTTHNRLNPRRHSAVRSVAEAADLTAYRPNRPAHLSPEGF